MASPAAKPNICRPFLDSPHFPKNFPSSHTLGHDSVGVRELGTSLADSSGVIPQIIPFILCMEACMRRLLRLENSESVSPHEPTWHPKRKNVFDGTRLNVNKPSKGNSGGIGQCAECGGDVKIFVSPRRNPHSSKIGRAVSMKDHDLCRRCWRRLMHQQRQGGVVVLPVSMFIGGKKLHPRLLVPKSASLPREAS